MTNGYFPAFCCGCLLLLLICICESVPRFFQGPRFVREPQDRIIFLNSSGAVIPCRAEGKPTPQISWIKKDGASISDIPGIRQQRTDGSLTFLPFPATNYRPDVHSAIYKCLASNSVGIIASREVHVRGVVHQDYEINVYDDFVIRGNTAVLRCHVPSFVRDYQRVTSWTRDDGLQLLRDSRAQGGKYYVTSGGELLIRHTDRGSDRHHYRCHVKDDLTGQQKSSKSGRLIVTDPTNSVPPRVSYRQPFAVAYVGQITELSCAAQSYPPPTYTWHRIANGKMIPVGSEPRYQSFDGTLVISSVNLKDAGKFICAINNTIGSERTEVELMVRANISVVLRPSTVSVEVGQSVTFNCSVTGYPVTSVQWLKNLQPIVASGRIRYIGRHHLHISTIQRQDQGMYQCTAYGEGQSAQDSAQLTLSEDIPTLKSTFSRQVVRIDERISLRCLAFGNPLPRVTWTLDGRPIPETHRVQYGDFVSTHGEVVSFVNITNAIVEDGGIYSCEATNEAGSSRHTERVDVYGPPFIRPMGNITVVAGSDLRFHCPVGGYPPSNITWLKDGRKMPLNERQQTFANGTLVIINVTREGDDGKYVCLAEREAHRVQRELKLIVLKKPIINPFYFPSNLVAGMRVIVTCNILIGDAPIHIRWLKDGQSFLTSGRGLLNVEESPMGDLGSSLVFSNIGRANNGDYTCLAENSAGTANFTANMVVNVAPSWKIEPHDVSAILGENVVLNCQADGYPPPHIRWKKSLDPKNPHNFQSLISNYHVQSLENGSLIIHNLEKSDESFYLCEATNSVGVGISRTVHLSVHVAAHFTSDFQFLRVRKSNLLKITCEAFGESPLTVHWTKEQLQLDSTLQTRYSITQRQIAEGIESTLVVNAVDRRETARYTCHTLNKYGSDETRIQVIVEEPPDAPTDVKVTDVTSRSVLITWSVPYTGNSQISRYLVQWKLETERWQSNSGRNEIEVVGSETKTSIQRLTPVSSYQVRIVAENAVGKSQPSEDFTFVTDSEVPEEPPKEVQASAVSSHSVRVSWKVPHKSHGEIQGFYVGYKMQNSEEPLVYKTLDSATECVLTNLRRYTKYVVTVQAFNAKGAGPPSKEVVVRTLENDPPISPTLRAPSTSSSSVLLAWDAVPGAKGYIIYYTHGNEGKEISVQGDADSYTMTSLTCGTHYQFYIVAYNEVGKSTPSEVLSLTTQGVAPIAPAKHKLMSFNSTYVLLNLMSWEDGGCPIFEFGLQTKARDQPQWDSVSTIQPSQEKYLLSGLSPGTWYNLLMSARSSAGLTEAEYVFATLTPSGATLSPAVYQRESETSSSMYRSLPVIVPLVCAAVVLVVIILVVLVVCLKRNRQDNLPDNNHSERVATENMKGDTISMTSVGKKTLESQRETLYYPSPYATTRVSMYSAESESSSGQTNNSLQRGRANVQRGEHTYDVPFPPKQFMCQPRHPGVVHDYQPLRPLSPEYRQRDAFTKLEQTNCSEVKQREWNCYNKLMNHRVKDPGEMMHCDAYRSYPEGASDYDSNPEEYDLGSKWPPLESHELSETECDRDYNRIQLKHSSHLQAQNLPTYPYDIIRPKSKDYAVYFN